jgi:TPR repeat protein
MGLLYRPARRGYPAACYLLGHWLCFEEPPSASPAEGMQWLRRAAAGGNADALADLARLERTWRGTVFQDPPRTRRGLARLRQAAWKGSPAAKHSLGSAYATGEVVSPDLAMARYWYGAAAAAGRPEAMYTLGMMWLTGEGGARDTGEAVRWLETCARGGVAEWPHSEFAADVLASVYAGEAEAAFQDPALSERWERLARRLEASAASGRA